MKNRPQWRVIEGGSREYLRPLCSRFERRIRVNAPVASVVRLPQGGVELVMRDGSRSRFDQVVIATHSDQALKLLAEPSPLEREILGAIPYQENDVVLHTDIRLLPRNRKTWSSWNYTLTGGRPPRRGDLQYEYPAGHQCTGDLLCDPE